KPDNVLGGPFLLQALHVAAVIVLLGIRTALVVPLQDNVLALVIGKPLVFAVAVDRSKVRRRVAHAASEGRCYKCQEKAHAESRIADFFHSHSSLRSNIMHSRSLLRHGGGFVTGAASSWAHQCDKPPLRQEPEPHGKQQSA